MFEDADLIAGIGYFGITLLSMFIIYLMGDNEMDTDRVELPLICDAINMRRDMIAEREQQLIEIEEYENNQALKSSRSSVPK